MLDVTQLPVLLHPSRTKQILLLILCVAFTAGGVAMVRKGDGMGYLCAVFFGLGICIFVANMLPNASYLRIEKDSFTFCSLFRTHTVPWLAVEEFGAYKVKTRSMVGWNYIVSYDHPSKLRGLNKGLTGFEAALPDTYGLKALELAEQMEAVRAQCSTGKEASVVRLNGQIQL